MNKQDKLKDAHIETHCNKIVETQRGENCEISSKETIVIYRGSSIKLIAGFSSEIMEARSELLHLKSKKEKKKLSTKNCISGKAIFQE